MIAFLNWWDGVELWLSGLDFVLQTAVVMPIALALAYGLAVALDTLLGNSIRLTRRSRRSRWARHNDRGGGAG